MATIRLKRKYFDIYSDMDETFNKHYKAIGYRNKIKSLDNLIEKSLKKESILNDNVEYFNEALLKLYNSQYSFEKVQQIFKSLSKLTENEKLVLENTIKDINNKNIEVIKFDPVLADKYPDCNFFRMSSYTPTATPKRYIKEFPYAYEDLFQGADINDPEVKKLYEKMKDYYRQGKPHIIVNPITAPGSLLHELAHIEELPNCIKKFNKERAIYDRHIDYLHGNNYYEVSSKNSRPGLTVGDYTIPEMDAAWNAGLAEESHANNSSIRSAWVKGGDDNTLRRARKIAEMSNTNYNILKDSNLVGISQRLENEKLQKQLHKTNRLKALREGLLNHLRK